MSIPISIEQLDEAGRLIVAAATTDTFLNIDLTEVFAVLPDGHIEDVRIIEPAILEALRTEAQRVLSLEYDGIPDTLRDGGY